MDLTSVKQGKETWLQPSGELQNKTRQDMAILDNWELYWSINWCWSAGGLSPRPSPFITLNHPILRCPVCTAACCNAAMFALLHAATLPGLIAACCNAARSALLHCCNAETWQHYWSLLLCCRIQAMTIT